MEVLPSLPVPQQGQRKKHAPSRAISTRELEDRRRTLIERGEIVDRSVVKAPLPDDFDIAAGTPSSSADSSSAASTEEAPKLPKGIPKGAVKMGMMPMFDPSAVKLKSAKK